MSPIILSPYRYGASGGTAWVTPPALPVTSGLWMHLQRGVGLYTDAGTTLATTQGDTIYRWADQSGLGHHADPFSPGFPTFYPTLDITNSHLTIPTLRFANVSQSGGHRNGFALANPSALTVAEIFVVIKTDADPPPTAASSGIYSFGTSGSGTHYCFTDGNIYDDFGSTTRKTVGNPTPSLSSTYRVYNVYSRGSATGDPDGDTALWRASLDNTSLFSTTTNAVAFQTAPVFSAEAGGFQILGQVAEVIMYSRKLTTAERTSVYGYCISN